MPTERDLTGSVSEYVARIGSGENKDPNQPFHEWIDGTLKHYLNYRLKAGDTLFICTHSENPSSLQLEGQVGVVHFDPL